VFTAVPPVPAALPLAPAPISSASTASLTLPAHTSLHVRGEQLDVLAGQSATVGGSLRSHNDPLSRRTVVLQTLAGRTWHTIARARTNATGRFRLRYTPRQLGSEPVRVSFAGDPFDAASHRRLGRLNVFRLAEASWYGGGGGLACGGQLTSSTLGVANKTLPCGTLVTLRYGTRTIRVPVVDRGPYVEGREFDLTEATKYALGFGDTGEVWSTR
jgi:peptidoglycan lytic transglycosylase